MEKLWTGRFTQAQSQLADYFNASIAVDSRMYRQDIVGSLAHSAMLTSRGIITQADGQAIAEGLESILADLESGALTIDSGAEDIHSFVESVLTERVGEAGKRLHTARSRNDQVALDLRLYLREEIDVLQEQLKQVLAAIVEQAQAHRATIMPGYTHLQRAQPITFGQHLMAYAMMLLRDRERLVDAARRMNVSPIGCCALAGTTYDTDRVGEAEALGFAQVARNSLDGVSDRDFCVELLSALSLIMMHLSRFSEELILWSSWEFQFVELSDAYTTGSSIMPQKKNPDMAELVRGKTGRVYGDLMAMLTMLKALPLAYNKDMQEDKEAVFDGVDTVKQCLGIFAPLLQTMRVLPENMLAAAQKGFLNATDLADYLVGKGLPFRTAYQLVGALVAHCIAKGSTLEQLSLEEYQRFDSVFDEDLYDCIDLGTCVRRRNSLGGTAPEQVAAQIQFVQQVLAQ